VLVLAVEFTPRGKRELVVPEIIDKERRDSQYSKFRGSFRPRSEAPSSSRRTSTTFNAIKSRVKVLISPKAADPNFSSSSSIGRPTSQDWHSYDAICIVTNKETYSAGGNSKLDMAQEENDLAMEDALIATEDWGAEQKAKSLNPELQ